MTHYTTPMRADELISRCEEIVSATTDRLQSLQTVANLLKDAEGYRWVGLYDVDRHGGLVRNVAWAGPSAPTHLSFPVTEGLTGAAVAERRTINVGDVTRDSRYLTALGTTTSEIIVPIFDASRKNVIGTIDVSSAKADTFGRETQSLLEMISRVIRPLWNME